jgi:uncharacterized protein YjbJ (UPF0337 family)
MDNRNRTPEEIAAEHRGRGILNQMKGSVRSAWGAITGNRRHTIGGKIDQMKGRVEEGVGNLMDPNRPANNDPTRRM